MSGMVCITLRNVDALVLWLISGAKPSGKNSAPRRSPIDSVSFKCRDEKETLRKEIAKRIPMELSVP